MTEAASLTRPRFTDFSHRLHLSAEVSLVVADGVAAALRVLASDGDRVGRVVVVVDGELQVRSVGGFVGLAALTSTQSTDGTTHLDPLLVERHGVSEDSDGAVGEGEMSSAHVANAADRVWRPDAVRVSSAWTARQGLAHGSAHPKHRRNQP